MGKRVFLGFLMILIGLSGVSQTIDLQDGLIAYYSFDRNTQDQSGNNNHGQPTGILQSAEDRFGNSNGAYEFDGSTYVTIPFSPSFVFNEFTYSAWIQTNNPENNWQTILTTTGNSQFYSVRSGQVSIWGRCGNGPSHGTVGSAWHHVVWTVREDQYFVYLDGNEVGTGTNCSPSASVQNLFIGAEQGGVYPFYGIIDDVRIYQRVLSSSEIGALYNETLAEKDLTLQLSSFIVDEGNSQIEVLVRNVGQESVSSMSIEYAVNNEISTTIFPLNLQPQDTITILLDEISFTPDKLYQVQAWVRQVDGQADMNHFNDTTKTKIIAVNPSEPHYALNFSNRSYVKVDPNPRLIAESFLTMEAWVYPIGNGSGGANGGIIFNKEEEYQMARFADGSLRISFGNSQQAWSTIDWINTGHIIPLEKWTHIAVTFNQGNIKSYANGKLVFSQKATHSTIRDYYNLYQSEVRIGGRNRSYNQNFDGLIDEVRLWNVARTESQIQRWMSRNLGLAQEDGLIAAYHFGENKGEITYSLTSGLDGQLVDGVNWEASSAPIGDNQFSVDAGITSVVLNQNIANPRSYEVMGIVHNFGKADLNSVRINWAVNDQTQTVVNWTGGLASHESDTVKLGSYSFASGKPNKITASTNSPNGLADLQTANDQTILEDAYTALEGAFTIGGPNADFDSLKTAISVLNTVGVIGNVTFNINVGTYREQVVITEFPGSSCENKVVFQSGSGNREDVKITWQATGNDNYIIQLNGADGVQFKNLTFEEEGGDNNRILDIRGGADCNLISNCHLLAEPERGVATSRSIIFSPSQNERNSSNEISNNLIENGSIGIGLYGENHDIKILNNRFLNQSGGSIVLENYYTPKIIENFIQSDINQTSFFGIKVENQGDSVLIEKNHIVSNGGSGIELEEVNALCRIINNYIKIGSESTAYGIYLESSTNTEIYHNSIEVISSNIQDGISLYINGGAENSFTILNNIFANTGGGYAIYNTSLSPFANIDYNNIYSSGSQLAFWTDADTIANLLTWQDVSGNDIHSISVDPLFVEDTLGYRVAQQELDGTGILLEFVSEDIEGEPRGQSPDLGADEFTLQPNDIGVSAIVDPTDYCGMGTSDSIQVEIQNYGSSTQSSFQIAYQINRQPPVIETLNINLSAGQKISYTFNDIDFSSPGIYNLRAYTILSGDQNVRNDSVSNYQFQNFTPTQPPTELTPTDQTTDLNLPLTFTWEPSENVESYDLFVWPNGESRPADPIISNLTRIRYTYYGRDLTYGTSYQWQVVAKNLCSEADSEIQSFTLRDLPDLTVSSISIPQDQILLSDKEMTVRWEITNVGEGKTLSPKWFEYAYLSRDTVIGNNDDRRVGSLKNATALDPGQSYQQELTFSLPRDAIGGYYLFVRISPYQLRDTVVDNNIVYSAKFEVTPSPHPDLKVTAVTQPIKFNIFSSGDRLPIEWNVLNDGSAAPDKEKRFDRIFLSTEATFDQRTAIVLGERLYSNQGLEPDQEIVVRDTFNIPIELDSTYMVFVETNSFSSPFELILIDADFPNKVFEHGFEFNNLSQPGDSFDIVRRNPPDLVIDTVTAPGFASIQQPIIVTWQVSNVGLNDTWQGNWVDIVYLSSLDTFDKNQATEIGRFPNRSKLARTGNYTRSETIAVPNIPNGNYYVYVVTDALKQEFEHDGEFNNTSRAITPTQISTPDLTSSLSNLDTLQSGQGYTITYSYVNQGSGALYQGKWTNRLLLTENLNNLNASAYDLGQTTQATPQLDPNNPESIQQTFVIPDGLEGEYYIMVQTDNRNQIYESNENNNQNSDRVWIELADYPDLVVASIQEYEGANAGESITFSYEIENQGVGSTGNATWNDVVYLSPTSRPTDNRVLRVATVQQSQPLAPNQSRTTTVSILLPDTLTRGQYYLIVATNPSQDLYEHGPNSQNNSRSQAIAITSYPPSDLVLSDFTVETEEIRSGAPFNFSYKVINQGEASLLFPRWEDALYLSMDTSWDPGDILIKRLNQQGPLPVSASYEVIQTANFPNEYSGPFYLIAVTDRKKVQHDSDYSNNYQVYSTIVNEEPVSLNVTYTPPPDLQITNVEAPSVASQGQVIQVKYSVVNKGVGTTIPYHWKDEWVLSEDEQYSGDDIQLYSYSRKDSLVVGESYEVTLELFIPREAKDNYFLLLKTDAADQIYEDDKENNNTYVSSIRIDRAFPSDLIISITQVPTSVFVGESMKVVWQTRNIGDNPTEGKLSESLYLSEDTLLDNSDPLLYQHSTDILLAPLQVISDSAEVLLDEVKHQDYYIIAYTDVNNTIIEDDENNNIVASNSPMQVNVEELVLNQEVTTNLIENRYYRIVIPDSLAGESLSVQLKSDKAESQNLLFLSFEEAPNRAIHDFATRNPLQADQELIVPKLQAGTYYLLARSESGEQEITISANILEFEIKSITSNQGGNTGIVTVKLEGGQFDQSLNVFLLKDGLEDTEAIDVQVVNPTLAYVSFNLAGKPIGTYTVVAEKDNGKTDNLPDAFQVVTSTAKGLTFRQSVGGSNTGNGKIFSCCDSEVEVDRLLEIDISHPESTRPNRIVNITFTVENEGVVDIPYPTRFLVSVGGAPIAQEAIELEQDLRQIYLEFREQDGPPDVLRPGAEVSITVYTRAVAPLQFQLVE